MPFDHVAPNPQSQSEFYRSVPVKRAIAWVIDLCFTALLSLPVILPFLILGAILIFPLFAIPAIMAIVGFLYRWGTLSAGSATWGMRIMAIELRDKTGQRLDGSTAFWHTAGTAFSFAVSPLQLVSALAMVLTGRGQGLTDMVLGTVMLNRAAR